MTGKDCYIGTHEQDPTGSNEDHKPREGIILRCRPILKRQIEVHGQLVESLRDFLALWGIERLGIASSSMILKARASELRTEQKKTGPHLVCNTIGVKVPPAEGQVFIAGLVVQVDACIVIVIQ